VAFELKAVPLGSVATTQPEVTCSTVMQTCSMAPGELYECWRLTTCVKRLADESEVLDKTFCLVGNASQLASASWHCWERGGHSPQLHDLPPGADGFLCVAEESDCTSVFSTLQLHDQGQVNFQDFSATSYSAVHDSPLPPATSYAFSYRISPEFRGFTVAGR
jgi:hypothetical protein